MSVKILLHQPFHGERWKERIREDQNLLLQQLCQITKLLPQQQPPGNPKKTCTWCDQCLYTLPLDFNTCCNADKVSNIGTLEETSKSRHMASVSLDY